MPNVALISVFCADHSGFVANVTGCLFDLGGDLGDTNFAVLGGGAEFSSVCELPDDVSLATVEGELKALSNMANATISVTPLELDPNAGPSGTITHRILVSGGDRPGLIARLCEVFVQYKVNIVRMNSQRVMGSTPVYAISFSVWIPDDNATACIATVANTAGEMGLSCSADKVSVTEV